MADVKLLSESEFIERSRAKRKGPLNYYAFYSSFTGGVVTDPTLMTIPADDHLVHRGHGVFDTATLSNGYLYRLDLHLDRFLDSARLAKITLPFPRERLRDIIIKTVAISGQKNGAVRYWLGAGAGDFGVTPAPGAESTFYVLVFGGTPLSHEWMEHGIKEVTIKETPMKPGLLAVMKSNNYLLNALYAMEARERGGKFGILVRDDGTLAESAVLNISFVTQGGVFKTPLFDDILPGTTVRAAMDVARRHVAEGGEFGLTDVMQTTVTLDDLKNAREAFLSGGDTHIFPLVEIDGHPIGDGRVGAFTKHLIAAVEEIAQSGTTSDHIRVDYASA